MMHYSSSKRHFLTIAIWLMSLAWGGLYAQPGSWEPIQGYTGAPGERHENGFVQVGDQFILIGGRSSQWKLTEHYDFTANAWTQGAFHPLQMHHIQAVEIDGLVYVVGAMTGEFPDETPIENIYIYDPLATEWYLGPEIPAGRQRGAMGTVVYDNKIYMISGLTDGHNAGHVPYVDMYDPYTNTWTQLADAPRARDHFNAVVVGDQIYCAGGRRSKHNTTGLNSDMEALVDVYDIPSDTWTTLAAPLPTPRAGTATSLIGDEIFIIGGESDVDGAHKEMESLNITTETWTTTWDTLTDPRHGSQAITNNGVAYLAAGSRANSIEIVFTDTTFLEQFSPTATFAAPTGTAFTSSELLAPVTAYDFGSSIVDATSTYSLTLTNSNGTQAILVTDLNLSGADSASFGFSVAGNSPFQPMSIPPGESLTVDITFSPTEANDHAATFTYTHSGSNGPQTITLTGEGCIGLEGGPNGSFTESGGSVMFQAESEIPATGSEWVQGEDAGTIYYEWTGANAFDTPGEDTIKYAFTITTPGIYRFSMRSQQFDFGAPTSGNDIWVSFPDADAYEVFGTFPTPTTQTLLAEWFQVFQSDVTGWSWYTSAEEFNDLGIYLDIPAAGTYNMLITGRSTGFQVDKFALHTYQQELSEGALDSLAASPRVITACLNEWYEDFDADTYGNTAITQLAVTQPAGFVDNADDCVDTDPSINPGAVELADGIDNNCDSQVDEGWIGTCEAVRINCGSDTAYTTAGGELFQADTYFGAETATYSDGSLAIANTLNDGLFHTTRSSNIDLGSMSYNIPVINGEYVVVLHFAEIFFGVGANGGGIGSRAFDIILEDTTRLVEFDILADPQSGGASATAVAKSFPITVFDQVMNITLDADTGANRPKISAIELLPQTACGSGDPFPIELLSFEGQRTGDQITLSWRTASELNNDFFTIEKSVDGDAFHPLATIDAAGNSRTEQAYQFVDPKPVVGQNYYRLKQTDLDGQFTYSNAINVTFQTTDVVAYPNPLQRGDQLQLALTVSERTSASISLLNLLGQTLSREQSILEPGEHVQQLPTAQLEAGYYLLNVTVGARTYVQKIVITD